MNNELTYYGIQMYEDNLNTIACWTNTPYKSLEEVERAHKVFGCKSLKSMPFKYSWFEEYIYYYIDSMGHYVLFRCIKDGYREVFNRVKEQSTIGKIGKNVDYCFSSGVEKVGSKKVNKKIEYFIVNENRRWKNGNIIPKDKAKND